MASFPIRIDRGAMSFPVRGPAPAPDGATPWWILHIAASVLVGKEQTGGLYSLIELRAAPGVGASRHVHRLEDESILVHQGALRVDRGDDTLDVQAGATVFLPRGVPHNYLVTSSQPFVGWQITAPAGHEDLFSEARALALSLDAPPAASDAKRLCDIAATHGVDILRPRIPHLDLGTENPPEPADGAAASIPAATHQVAPSNRSATPCDEEKR